jgi:hypothetical protein
MKQPITSQILQSYNAGDDVAAVLAQLDLADQKVSKQLCEAWRGIANGPTTRAREERAKVLELLRAALQDADVERGLNTGGLARCPLCIHMCLWGEDKYCEHYVGVQGCDLEEQDLLRCCGASVADRWRVAWGAAEGVDPPPGILPDMVSKHLGSSSVDDLFMLVIHCGAVSVDSASDDGRSMQMVFAECTTAFGIDVTEWVEKYAGWADAMGSGESE